MRVKGGVSERAKVRVTLMRGWSGARVRID